MSVFRAKPVPSDFSLSVDVGFVELVLRKCFGVFESQYVLVLQEVSHLLVCSTNYTWCVDLIALLKDYHKIGGNGILKVTIAVQIFCFAQAKHI